MAPSSQAKNPVERGGRKPLRLAWVAVAFIPVAFVLAMVVGEGLIDALGYSSADPPLWLALLVGGPVTLLAMAPAALAVVYGRRARRAGSGRAASTTIVIVVVVAAYWGLTFAAGVAQRLTG